MWLQVGGTVFVSTLFGAAGAGLGGYAVAHRTAGVREFIFKPLRAGMSLLIEQEGVEQAMATAAKETLPVRMEWMWQDVGFSAALAKKNPLRWTSAGTALEVSNPLLLLTPPHPLLIVSPTTHVLTYSS